MSLISLFLSSSDAATRTGLAAAGSAGKLFRYSLTSSSVMAALLGFAPSGTINLNTLALFANSSSLGDGCPTKLNTSFVTLNFFRLAVGEEAF